MVNVTKSNFLEQSNDLLKHLPTAAFVALDEEMTGISLPWSKRPSKDDTPSKRFESLRGAPERYSIIQVGIALFHEHPSYDPSDSNSDEFLVRRYNFYVFPPTDNNSSQTREVTLNPSTVAFLNKNNMSFDKWTKEGIPFLETERAVNMIAKHREELLQLQKEADGEEPPLSNRKSRRKVELTRADDVRFHARAMASLREWIDSSSRNGEAARALQEEDALDLSMSFLLPQCNSFLRRALYETLQTEYPSLVLERAGKESPNQIRVWRLNPAQQEERRIRLVKEKWENMMLEQVGFWRVFRALSNACRGLREENSVALVSDATEIDIRRDATVTKTGRHVPIVVHNGWMDLMFLFTHFHCQNLPDSYEETKALIHEYFPVVYDTKVLSNEYCLDSRIRRESTTLQKLHDTLVVQNMLDSHPNIAVADQGEGENGPSEQAHEAEYDAYMTGAIFATLCKSIMTGKCEDFKAKWKAFGGENYESDVSDYSGDAANAIGYGGVGSLLHLLAPVQDQDVRQYFGRNKIFFFLGLYNTDLEESAMDPLKSGMTKENTFRVSGIDTSVSTRDIVSCLSGGVHLEYELVWVDDTTFMVATKLQNDETEEATTALHRDGQAIRRALRARFASQTIVTLDEHLKRVAAQESSEARFGKGAHTWWSSWAYKAWSMMGGGKKRAIGEGGDEQCAKRRRLY